MRITGGSHRGRILAGPEGDAIRPTADKVRQAVFNILNARGLVAGAVVLDAFCGTGALGIEALSHGARQALFIDQSKKAVDLCRKNLAAMKFEDRAQILHRDALAPGPLPPGAGRAALVFLDPPYRKDLVPLSCAALCEKGWIAPGARLVIECAADEDATPPGVEILVEKRYGDTRILVAAFTEEANPGA